MDGMEIQSAHPKTARRGSRNLLLVCALILGNEVCERLAFYGISMNLVMYLTSQLAYSNADASVQTNVWGGTCYIFPLLGAFLADTYLGRYWTILSFSCVYVVGLCGVAMSAALPSMHPVPPALASGGQSGFFWLAMYLVALGTGGIKPCVSTFGADQFDTSDPAEARMLTPFFLYFYCCINVGALVASLGLVYIQQEVGWGIGFGIPAICFMVALTLYVAGSRLYVRQPPGGSSLSRAWRVLSTAFVNRHLQLPQDSADLHEVGGPANVSAIRGQPKLPHTQTLTALDRAALVVSSGSSAGRRASVTVTEVEELKSLLRFLPLLVVSVLWWMTYNQMSTLFILSGEAMDTRVGSINLPSATMNAADIIAVLLCAPLYEQVITPLAVRWRGRPINLLWRIGAGYVLGMLAMVAAAIVETWRLQLVAADPRLLLPDATAPISILWQIPQYFLIGAAEVCSAVGVMELLYRENPASIRSLAQSLSLLATGLSSYATGALTSAVQAATSSGGRSGWVAENLNRSRLDLFFWLLAGIELLGLGLYILCARNIVQHHSPESGGGGDGKGGALKTATSSSRGLLEDGDSSASIGLG